MTSARLLVARPLARTIRWAVLAASLLPAAWIVWQFRSDPYGTSSDAALGLRLAALSLALGLSFILEDSTEDLTAPSPVSLLARRAVRIAMTLAPAVGAWFLLALWINSAPFMTKALPVGPMLLEMLALAAVGLSGAALGSRRLADGLGGPAGVGAVVMAGIASAMLPWGGQLLAAMPGTPEYGPAQRSWLAILLAALIVLVCSSLTPGATRLRPPRARARRPPEPLPPV